MQKTENVFSLHILSWCQGHGWCLCTRDQTKNGKTGNISSKCYSRKHWNDEDMFSWMSFVKVGYRLSTSLTISSERLGLVTGLNGIFYI